METKRLVRSSPGGGGQGHRSAGPAGRAQGDSHRPVEILLGTLPSTIPGSLCRDQPHKALSLGGLRSPCGRGHRKGGALSEMDGPAGAEGLWAGLRTPELPFGGSAPDSRVGPAAPHSLP